VSYKVSNSTLCLLRKNAHCLQCDVVVMGSPQDLFQGVGELGVWDKSPPVKFMDKYVSK